MILTLEIVGEQAEEFGARGRKVFHAVGGTIGRLPDNDWVFPDPYVSGRHALVRYVSGKFFVEDTSTNGVYLNSPDNRLPKGQPHALTDGDLLYIDAFRINVSIESDASLDENDTLGMLKDASVRRPAPIPAKPATGIPPKATPAASIGKAPVAPPPKPAIGKAPAPDATVFEPAEDDHTIGMHAGVADDKTEWTRGTDKSADKGLFEPSRTEWMAPAKPTVQDPNKTEWLSPAKVKAPPVDDKRTEWIGSSAKPLFDPNQTEWIAPAKPTVQDPNKTEWMAPSKARPPTADDKRTEWIAPAKPSVPDPHKTEWMAPSKSRSAAAEDNRAEWMGSSGKVAFDPNQTEWSAPAKPVVQDDNKTQWMPPAKAKAPAENANRTEWSGIPNTPAGDDNKTEYVGSKAAPPASEPAADIRPPVPPRSAAPAPAVKAAPATAPAPPKPLTAEANKRTSASVSAASEPAPARPREPMPAREPARASSGRGDEAMMRQMLASAGIVGVEPTEELAQTIGEVLRIAVSGMMEVQRARERLKDELRVRGTVFKPAHNNPLKFSANVEDAFHNLLLKHNAAYLDPTAAFDEAFHDLRDHHAAILSAMRLAFESMLAQFDPARMQEEFDRQMKKGSILGVPVKLRYWELYRDRYSDMIKDADTSFRHLFGEKFAVEYEEQLERLKSQYRDHDK